MTIKKKSYGYEWRRPYIFVNCKHRMVAVCRGANKHNHVDFLQSSNNELNAICVCSIGAFMLSISVFCVRVPLATHANRCQCQTQRGVHKPNTNKMKNVMPWSCNKYTAGCNNKQIIIAKERKKLAIDVVFGFCLEQQHHSWGVKGKAREKLN